MKRPSFFFFKPFYVPCRLIKWLAVQFFFSFQRSFNFSSIFDIRRRPWSLPPRASSVGPLYTDEHWDLATPCFNSIAALILQAPCRPPASLWMRTTRSKRRPAETWCEKMSNDNRLKTKLGKKKKKNNTPPQRWSVASKATAASSAAFNIDSAAVVMRKNDNILFSDTGK